MPHTCREQQAAQRSAADASIVLCTGGHAYGTVSLPSCRALVQHNAKVNEPDSKLRTPLFLAYVHGHVLVAHYLWDKGANPANSYGLNTALFVEALRVRPLQLFVTVARFVCCTAWCSVECVAV